MQPFLKGSLKEFEFLAGGAQTGEHRTSAGRHGPDLPDSPGASPHSAARPGSQSLGTAADKQSHFQEGEFIQKNPSGCAGRPLGEAVTGAWAGAKPQQSPLRAEPGWGLHHSAPSPAPRSPSMEQGWLSSRERCGIHAGSSQCASPLK